jgi:hypothetical protein
MANTREVAPLYGGAAYQRDGRKLSVCDLQNATDLYSDPIKFVARKYDLLKYVPRAKVDDADLPDNVIVCQFPMSPLISLLNVNELRDLCCLHTIRPAEADVCVLLMDKLREHRCSGDCEECYAVLVPIQIGGDPRVLSIDNAAFPETCRLLSPNVLNYILTPEQLKMSDVGSRSSAHLYIPLSAPDLTLSLSKIYPYLSWLHV